MDIEGLGEGRQRYGFFTNAAGGILDDLMLANRGDHIFMVVNAACKEADIAHMHAHLPAGVTLSVIRDRALLALQGPAAEAVLSALNPAAADMAFNARERCAVLIGQRVIGAKAFGRDKVA